MHSVPALAKTDMRQPLKILGEVEDGEVLEGDTFLNLAFIPVLYVIVKSATEWRRRPSR